MQKKASTHTPMWVRVTAITMAILTSSGILAYLMFFLIGLFS